MAEKRLAIGLFNECYPPIADGVSTVMENYAHRLREMNHQVSVVTATIPNYHYPNQVPIIGIPSIPILSRPPYRAGLPVFTPYYIDYKLKGQHFDIFHAHSPFFAGRGALHVAKKRNIPIVATFHSKFKDDFTHSVKNKALVELLLKSVVRYFESVDEVWVPQPAVGEVLRSYGYKGNYFVSPNGIDYDLEATDLALLRSQQRKRWVIDPDQPIFLFVGQHIWEKNIRLVIESLAQIKDDQFHCYFIGKGYATEAIKELISHLGLQDHITMVGPIYSRSELSKYYAIADLFLFPSLYDNAPLVVKEAAAHHLPSLLLAGSTSAEIIEDHVNGFLSLNHPDQYAATIRSIMADTMSRQRVALTASQTVGQHWDKILPEVVERYRWLIEKSKCRG